MACGKQRQQLLFYLRLSVVMNRTKKGAVFFFQGGHYKIKINGFDKA